MNGAESLLRTLLAGGIDTLPCKSRDQRDAFRVGARSDAWHARGSFACSRASPAALPTVMPA